ncbi:MAG TPA: hypothetical protein VK483_14695 [Chitinophagaceae bacterium]|nr:hypothetical protein [Chitinophagaceae bacterium]
MKRIHIFSVFIFPLLLSCSSTKNSTDKKIGGKTYNNLFIIANTADIEFRVRLEKELALAAESKGYKAVKSIDVIPPVLNDPKPPSQEELAAKVKATGCDALCIVYFLKNGDDVKYNAGMNFKGTDPMLSGFVGILVLGFKEYSKKVDRNDDTKYKKDISAPAYYTKEKGFYLLSELYDATSVENVYSEKSGFFDEAELVSFSHSYMADLIKHLEEKKILKK